MKPEVEPQTKSVLETMNFRGAATQKVKTFILEEAQRFGKTERWRLPSMRKLADHLGVSVATVQLAYRQLGKEGVICTDPSRASYVAPVKKQGKQRLFHVGIDFIKGDEDPNCSWRGSIYGGMLNQTLGEGNRIVFHQIPAEISRREDLAPPDQSYSLDGALLAIQANIDRWEEFETGIPAVHFGKPSAVSTKGFVIADIFNAARQVGQAFRASGRRRIYLAGFSPHIEKSEGLLGFAGLMAGYGANQRSGAVNFLNFQADDDERKIIKQLFKGGGAEAPDAFFCPSDYAAMRLLKHFWALDIKVPEQVSVVGGTGLVLMNTPFFTMTRAFQPMAEIGAELVRRLIATMESGQKESSFAGIALPCSFGGGATTLPQENAVLGLKY